MIKYLTPTIDHLVAVGVGVRAGVARYPLHVDHNLHLRPTPVRYPQYRQSHHAVYAHAHVHVHTNDLTPAHGHGQDLKDGMNPTHGLIQNMKLSSAPEKNHTRRGWRFVVEWLRSGIILSLSKSQCDHGVKIIKNYYLLHHLRLFEWMKILRIMLPRLLL